MSLYVKRVREKWFALGSWARCRLWAAPVVRCLPCAVCPGAARGRTWGRRSLQLHPPPYTQFPFITQLPIEIPAQTTPPDQRLESWWHATNRLQIEFEIEYATHSALDLLHPTRSRIQRSLQSVSGHRPAECRLRLWRRLPAKLSLRLWYSPLLGDQLTHVEQPAV